MIWADRSAGVPSGASFEAIISVVGTCNLRVGIDRRGRMSRSWCCRRHARIQRSAYSRQRGVTTGSVAGVNAVPDVGKTARACVVGRVVLGRAADATMIGEDRSAAVSSDSSPEALISVGVSGLTVWEQ